MEGETPFMAQRRILHELKEKQDAALGEAAPKPSKKKRKKKTSSSST